MPFIFFKTIKSQILEDSYLLYKVEHTHTHTHIQSRTMSVFLSVSLTLKISLTAKPIGLYSSGNIPTDPVAVISYFLVGRGGGETHPQKCKNPITFFLYFFLEATSNQRRCWKPQLHHGAKTLWKKTTLREGTSTLLREIVLRNKRPSPNFLVSFPFSN